MCARYGANTEYNVLEKHLNVQLPPVEARFKDVIYPHHMAPVIAKNREGKVTVVPMNYSLVPYWSKVRKPKFTTYNARIEEMEQKQTWREPFQKKHCLVPMRYFLESAHFGDFNGYMIKIQSDEPLIAAGVWDLWINPENQEKVISFAIITTEPSEQIYKAGHDRSPLFLNPKEAVKWLERMEKPRAFLQSHQVVPHFYFLKYAKLKTAKPQEV